MSDHATVQAHAAASRSAARVGSFEIGPRVLDGQQRLGNTALVTITGAAGTQYAGYSGFAYCAALPENNPALFEQANAHMQRIAAVQGPNLVPVIEAGVSGRVAFVAETAIQGERLSARLAKERRLPAWLVAQIISDLTTGLEVAHAVRVSHGAIVPTVIWIDGANRAFLGGFGLAGRGPARDQEMLGHLAFEMFSGATLNPDFTANITGAALVERLRGQTNGLSERVASVIAKTIESDQALRYQSVSQFGQAIRDAAAASAADAAAGAWESIGQNDLAMAQLFFDSIVAYDPNCSEIPLLRHRMHDLQSGGSGFGAQMMAPSVAAMPAAAAAPDSFPMPFPQQPQPNFATPPPPQPMYQQPQQNPAMQPMAGQQFPAYAPAADQYGAPQHSGQPYPAQGFGGPDLAQAGYAQSGPLGSPVMQPGAASYGAQPVPSYGQPPAFIPQGQAGGSPSDHAYGQAMSYPQQQPATPDAFGAALLNADNMNPELRALLSPEIPPLEKPKNNPWIIFALGVLALVIVMTILVALTFFSV